MYFVPKMSELFSLWMRFCILVVISATYLDCKWFHVVTVAFSMQCTSGGVQAQVQVLPQGIEAVNGSSTDMGCTGVLVDSGDVMTCNSQSYLVDGCSPDIDTSTSDWASQLVTVRRNEGTAAVPFAHVLLTFGFDTAMSLTEIEMDLFLCPDWGIGDPRIRVYVNEEYDFVFNLRLPFTPPVQPSQSSCDSLTTVHLSGDTLSVSSYRTFHILVDLSHQSIEWVHVGEVRFNGGMTLGNGAGSNCQPVSQTMPASIAATSHLCIDSTCVASPTSTVSGPSSKTSVFHTNIPTSAEPETDETNRGLVIGLSVTLSFVFVLCAVTVAIVVAGCVFKSRRKHREFSDTDLGAWQNVTTAKTAGTEYQEQEQSTELGNEDHETNHVESMYPRGELPKYEDLNSNASFTNHEEAVYDEVPKEDLGDAVDYTDYDDIEPPSFTASQTAPQWAPDTENSVQSATHVYSHVKKSLPAVPQKSKDLVKYLERKETKNQPPNFSADPPSGNTARHASLSSRSQLAYNPVYEGSAEAMSLETQRFLDSTTGEEMYDRPALHRTVPLANVHEGFNLETEGATPQPSAPVINEPIQPSDFTSGYQGDDGGDPHIYAPVYAIPTVPAEASSQPVVITNDHIIEKKELGMGQFGKVVLAATNGLSLKDMQLNETDDNKNVSILVAVKRLAAKPSMEDRQGFEKEVKLMSCLKHQNVVSLIGVCYQDPAFIMMEYMQEGDLNRFLKRYSEIVPIITSSTQTQITTSTMVYMASQIASAMQYLASHNYIHRDLASRNCLVGENFIVKLADFGMSRSLYQSHYYRIQGNAILPIRWMATESFFGIFSEKTDVWAFGVTMWELFTLCKEDPYSYFTDTELVEDAIKGVHRQMLERPLACPKSVYKIMQQCWVIDPKGRATFRAVEEMLQTYWYTPDASC